MIHTQALKMQSYIFDRLYCKEINLFYDYITDNSEGSNTANLPNLTEISAQAPNPCGYSTGMEDSSLNGGIMLDAVVAAYKTTGDEKYKNLAREIYSGLRLCAEAHGYAGYIARSVSPFDKKSVYFDSSRDQFTNWVYGAYRYYESGIATEEHKESIKSCIIAVAEKCLRDVNEESNYSLLRADGKSGLVLGMWGSLGAHEYLRMPMFYLAAFAVSGETKWKKLYESYRDEAIEESFKIDCSTLWHAYCSLQMQYSVCLCRDLEDDENYKRRYTELSEKIADYYIARIEAMCKDATPEKLTGKFMPWRTLTARYRGIVGGRAYYNPAQPKEATDAFYILRDIGNSSHVIALAGKGTPEHTQLILGVMDNVDTSNHYTGGPIDLYGAYMLLEYNNRAK